MRKDALAVRARPGCLWLPSKRCAGRVQRGAWATLEKRPLRLCASTARRFPAAAPSAHTDLACAGRASLAQPRRKAAEVVFASDLCIESGIAKKPRPHPDPESFHGVSFREKEPDPILIRPSFDRLSWAPGRDPVTASLRAYRGLLVSRPGTVARGAGVIIGRPRAAESGTGPLGA